MGLMSIYDSDTGEIVNSKFVKLFLNNMGHVFSLSPKEGELLGCMIRDSVYGNKIDMTSIKKKKYMKEIEFKTLNSLSVTLRRLEKNDFVKRKEEGSTIYIINPNMIMKGNDYQRANILTWWSNGKQEFIVIDENSASIIKDKIDE